MKKLALVIGMALFSGCSMIPNLGIGGDMVRGKVDANGSQNVKVAIVRGTGADLSNAEVVSVDSTGYFSYLIPQTVDALTICAFEDKNNNNRFDEGELTSRETSSGSSYLRLTRMGETWDIVEETSTGAHQRDSLTSADLVLQS